MTRVLEFTPAAAIYDWQAAGDFRETDRDRFLRRLAERIVTPERFDGNGPDWRWPR